MIVHTSADRQFCIISEQRRDTSDYFEHRLGISIYIYIQYTIAILSAAQVKCINSKSEMEVNGQQISNDIMRRKFGLF